MLTVIIFSDNNVRPKEYVSYEKNALILHILQNASNFQEIFN